MTATNSAQPPTAIAPSQECVSYEPDRLLTAQELAEWAQVPLRTVRQWASRGGGPARHQVGRHVRYRWSDCLTWLEANRVD